MQDVSPGPGLRQAAPWRWRFPGARRRHRQRHGVRGKPGQAGHHHRPRRRTAAGRAGSPERPAAVASRRAGCSWPRKRRG